MSIDISSQREDNAAWPVAPSFLVKSVISGNEKYSLNKHGVYASDTVRGLLADASDDPDIHNSVSLFQIVPETCEFERLPYIGQIRPAKDDFYLNDILKEKRVVRIDPNYLYKNKTCCDKFRACNGFENKCHEQDCRIALLYHKDLNGIHYADDFEDYFSTLNQIIDDYNKEFAKEYPLHCERDVANQGLYIWYKCPYSNLLEYFFPIVHSGKVIAVLMQGQRIPETLKRNEVFQNILNDNSIYTKNLDDLRQSIDSISEDEFGKEPMPEKRLNAIRKRIRTLEERIDEEVISHSRAYIHDNFHGIGQALHRQIKDVIKNKGELTDEAYKIIANNALYEICKIFNKNGFIRIYSTELKFEEKNPNSDTFDLVGTSSVSTDTDKSVCDKIEFQNLPSDVDKLGNMKNEDFYPYLLQKITFHEDMIFRIESLSIGNTKHLIWEKYPKKKEINQKQFREFSNFLKTFYHTLWEPYNLLRSVKLRKNLEASMRVSVHETSQIIPVITNTLQKEYNLDSRTLIQEDGLNLSGITQRANILYDTVNRLLLLDNLYRRSTLMFRELKPQKEWTDLHRLIYSVRSLFDEKAMANNKQKIVVNGLDDFKFNQYEVFTDYQLVSHALFNLVDNAIKYGYMGSLINIDISLSKTDLQHERNDESNLIDSIRISVVSYGPEIKKEEEEHLYELFYRSQASKVKDGMGIGLFLVKKICNSLNYNIGHYGRRLSDYNLPVYYYGDKQGITTSFNPISQTVIDEAVNKELSDKDWHIEDLEFTAAIHQATYRNEFIVTLNKTDNNLLKRIQS